MTRHRTHKHTPGAATSKLGKSSPDAESRFPLPQSPQQVAQHPAPNITEMKAPRRPMPNPSELHEREGTGGVPGGSLVIAEGAGGGGGRGSRHQRKGIQSFLSRGAYTNSLKRPAAPYSRKHMHA